MNVTSSNDTRSSDYHWVTVSVFRGPVREWCHALMITPCSSGLRRRAASLWHVWLVTCSRLTRLCSHLTDVSLPARRLTSPSNCGTAALAGEFILCLSVCHCVVTAWLLLSLWPLSHQCHQCRWDVVDFSVPSCLSRQSRQCIIIVVS